MNTLHKKAVAVAVSVTASSLMAASPARASIGGATPEDRVLAGRVEAALMQAPPLQDRLTDIRVEANGGQVALSGWVSHADDAALAARVARSVAGVRAVSPVALRGWSSGADYRVGVAPASGRVPPIAAGSEKDQALAQEVKLALLQAAPFQDSEADISVVALDGQVKLSGWVSYANDELAARRIAQSVAGVRQVRSELRSWSTDTDARVARAASPRLFSSRVDTQVSPSGSDQALVEDIQRALSRTAPFQERGVDIAVAVQDGKADLSGWISHADDERMAREVAASVPGVTRVRSHLRAWSSDQRH